MIAELPILTENFPLNDHEIVGAVSVVEEAPLAVYGHILPTVAAYSCRPQNNLEKFKQVLNLFHIHNFLYPLSSRASD